MTKRIATLAALVVLTAVLEPILIMGLAGVVGFIVISIVLPILKVGQIQ